MPMQRSKNLTFTAVTAALIIVLTALAEVIRLPVSIAFGFIPVIIISVFKGPKFGAITGLIFGLSSFTIALILSANPLYRTFVNPLVSVIPRIIAGAVPGLVYGALKKIKHPGKNFMAARFAAGLAGVLTNTVLVLGMLLAFNYGKDLGGFTINFAYVAAVIVSVNTVVEILLFPALTAGITYALDKAMRTD